MKKLSFCFLLLFWAHNLSAQKVVDRVIDNDERKKVEHARRLYNQYKIFDGEKILKELIKKNPNEVYFYVALVQMQRQVLYRIHDATGELQQMNLSKAAADSLRKETSESEDENEQAILAKPVNTKEIFESLGLDMAKINVKEKERTSDEEEASEPADATVTIDSSLIFSDEERNEFKKLNSGSNNKIDKKTQRKLKIIESFAQIPYDQYLYNLIQNARNATRLFINADSSSLYLRKFLSDTMNVNEGVSDEAWSEYIKGMEQLYDKVIPAAAKHLENAVELDPNFYTAHLKLGDVYYLMNKDTASIQQYKYASQTAPDKSEPFEKLAIMQYNRGRYTDAAATMITAIMKYPMSHYTALLKRIIEKTGLGFDPQWIPRAVFPLSTTHMNEEIIVDDKSPWWHYQASRQDVFNYFDTLGIVIPNDKTQERYLEVYAWKKMLNNSSPKHFQFARAMDKVGYLDCYVLVTLFHNDIYGQFKDFAMFNSDKIKKYFYLLINYQDKKFDKLGKSVEIAEKKDTEKPKPENKK